MLPPDPRNVLLCLRYGIGDVTMELPVLDSLRRALPRSRISVLANAPAHELLEGDPRVDEVVTTSRWGLSHLWDRGDEEARAAIGAWARAGAFDLALDVDQAVLAVRTVLHSVGIPSLESSSRAEREAVEAGLPGEQAIRAGVRAGWGLDVPASIEPTLKPRPEDHARARDLVESLGPAATPLVAVSPVSSTPVKAWPIERFAAVADHVADEGGRVLVLEGPQTERGEALHRAMRRPDAALRVGPLHLLATAALVARCGALVCNDTGLMHVAAAVGTCVVAVFGPTREEIYAPSGTHVTALGPHDLRCPFRDTRSLRPPDCWYRGECLVSERSCVERVPVADVLAALRPITSSRAQPARLRLGRGSRHRSCVSSTADATPHATGP